MNLTNLKLIWRNLVKNSGITSINVIGLSISFAVSTLIILFLQFEYSFDTSSPEHKNMYRLLTTFKYPNSPETPTGMASPLMAPNLSQSSPDIDNYLRIVPDKENFICRANGRERTIGKNLRADSTFFEFFDYPLLYGKSNNAFDKPDNILISRPLSEGLFGQADPVGKTLEYTYALDAGKDTTIQYIISAVFDHLPTNSHLQFESLMPIAKRQFSHFDEGNLWHVIMTSTYFKLRPSIKNSDQVAAKFPEYLDGKMPGHDMVGLALQPFNEIHLDSGGLDYDETNYQKSDRKYLQVLGLIALFIMLISSINFANLSTVLAMRRVREVGVRKSLGANKTDVLRQFLGEAMLMSIIGGSLALLWVLLLRQPFLDLLGKTVELSFTPKIIAGYLVAILLLGLLAGLFPAIQAARYSAVEAFQKLGTAVSVKRPFIQRLVVLQFIMSAMLIIGSLICYNQLDFMQNKELGFQFDQVIEMNMGNSNTMRSTAMKNEISNIVGVIDVSGSDVSLGSIEGQNGVMVRNEKTKEWENFPMSINFINPNYFDLYEMKFIAGRAPTPEGATNGNEYVVNESFLKRVGWVDDPIGYEIGRSMADFKAGKVVGVIKDIHHNTLHNPIGAVCFQATHDTPILSIKVDPANVESVLPQVETVWNTHIKDRPFDYQFKDAHFATLYAFENQLGQLLFIATILSILIACLGLLALSAFIIQQRSKEIGIRKVLGASTLGVIGLLSKDFLKLVFIAFIIATPIAWYIMDNWLNNFAYRIDVEVWTFALAGIVSIGIAFLTVGSQSLKAALNDPVKSIRTE